MRSFLSTIYGRLLVSYFCILLIALATGAASFYALWTIDRALDNATAVLSTDSEPESESGEHAQTMGGTIQIFNEASRQTHKLAHKSLPSVVALARMREGILAMAIGERTLFASMRRMDLKIREEDGYGTIAEGRADAEEAFEKYLSLIEDDAAAAADVESLREGWRAWLAVHDKILDISKNRLDPLMEKGVFTGMEFGTLLSLCRSMSLDQGTAARNALLQRLEGIIDKTVLEADALAAEVLTDAVVLDERLRASADDASRHVANARALGRFALAVILAASAAGLILVFVMAFVFARQIAAPLQRVTALTDSLAQGDLGAEVSGDLLRRRGEIGSLARSVLSLHESQRREVEIANELARGNFTSSIRLRSAGDSLGRAFAAMLSMNQHTLARVRDLVRRVADRAGDMAETNRDLARDASSSASSLLEMSETMTEIGGQVKRTSDMAGSANELAATSRTAVGKGFAAVTEMVAAAGESRRSGEQITKAVRMIDDLAFQTNLLAINASIEAARAGRHGKGFSVVADEVRRLAAQSASAAKDTASVVADMLEKFDRSAEIADSAHAALADIRENVDRVADLFGEIASANHQQSSAIGRVIDGIGQIDRLTRQTAGSAEETAGQARGLSEQALELQNAMAAFRLERDGAAQTKEIENAEILHDADVAGPRLLARGDGPGGGNNHGRL